MEILKFINNSSIENIPLLELERLINKASSKVNSLGQGLIIGSTNNPISIKCIREYYLDPISMKKMKKINLVNPCHKIQSTFGVETTTNNCMNCHLEMINKCYNKQSFLIRNKK